MICDRYEKICCVPVQCFRITVVFMFMPVFMLLLLLSSLMFCGLDGEVNGRDYVYVNDIYFDVYNFVSVVGVLFVAYLEGVSGTSGVKWELTRHSFALLAFSCVFFS